jgi:hypothetical protein|tara:strand:+ start:22180 stop:22353 length:174 start_codon:yes stop_codon:yes gene_type:complete
MNSYEVVFDGEYGVVFDTIEAKDSKDLLSTLCAEYPEDIGADGCYYDTNGDEFPIDW